MRRNDIAFWIGVTLFLVAVMLTTQVIRRLERLETGIAAERRERLEDFGLLVDLVASGWRGVERRLDHIERVTDRIERALEERPAAAPVYRLEGRGA